MRLVLFALGITVSSLSYIYHQKQMRDGGMGGISFSSVPSSGWDMAALDAMMNATLAQGRAFIGMQGPSDARAPDTSGGSLPQIEAQRVPTMQVAGMDDPAEMAKLMTEVEQQFLNSPAAKMVEGFAGKKPGSDGARFVKVKPRD